MTNNNTTTTNDSITLPVKRVTGETLEERMTSNAYNDILPARYLKENENGEVVEEPEQLFERIAKNIALAEVVYEAQKKNLSITAPPTAVKPDASDNRREELVEEFFDEDVEPTDSEPEIELTEENIKAFSYDEIMPTLTDDVHSFVQTKKEEFQEMMEYLSFMPNSPTIMNAGDELQQLSACFVNSPEDDIEDIHDKAKEAAKTFQCLTEDSYVYEQTKGLIKISEVKEGDKIVQYTDTGFEYKEVSETHTYTEADTLELELENGLSITGTPNHRIKINGDWTRFDQITPGDTVQYALGWLEENSNSPILATVDSGGRWEENREVSNEEILELYREGLSDYQIAEKLDTGSSTIQRRRANEMGLPSNSNTGRGQGQHSFEEEVFVNLYEKGYSDQEIAKELGKSKSTVQQFRVKKDLEPNKNPVKEVTQPQRLSVQLAELVGLWAGDGSYHKDGIRFHLSRDELVEWVKTMSESLFDTTVSTTYSDGCYEVTINSHEIKRWWKANFDVKSEGSQNVTVPAVITQASSPEIKGYLKGLFSADGAITDGKYPVMYSSSEKHIEQIATLLMGIGIPVKKSVIRDDEKHPYYNLFVTTSYGRQKFKSEIGFLDSRNVEQVNNPRDTYTGEDLMEVKVNSVHSNGKDTVYDITVEDNHEYITDGIVSHNSGGGMGYAFWKLRPYGDSVGSTGGIASGPITFMHTYDQMCETIAQGGTRRGAQMGVMRVTHPDVIQFIHAKNKDVSLAHTLRLNDPDDYTHNSFLEALEEARDLIDDEGRVPEHLRNAVEGHLSNFNISVGITDDFMDALENGEDFTFTNPRTEEPHIATQQTKELYSQFDLGEYVEVGEELSLPAEIVWDRIIEGAHENGEPGVIYLERVNKKHSFDVEEHPDHQILATNPCLTGDSEILLADGSSIEISKLAENGSEIRVSAMERNDSNENHVNRTAFNPRKTRTDAEVVKITGDNVSLTVTKDHKIWTKRNGYTEASELDSENKILLTTPKGEMEYQNVHNVEAAGKEDVYNITVEEDHNYFARTEGEDFINVKNCGEQPLEEKEACNLGHINFSTLVAEDSPNWKDWWPKHESEYDSVKDGVNDFLAKAIDWEEFNRRIQLGTRFLENVVTMSDFPVDSIEEKVAEMRKIGLGIMGLAQMYIQIGMRYGSEPANAAAEEMLTHMNHKSKETSNQLAGERGVFGEWDKSKYATPTEYPDWFERQTGKDPEDYEDGFPIRNHNTTTIAPTGTTSMLGNTTGGCEPMYNVAYYKNVSEDVQGDEMLVEFDDYFLRVLEENNVDVTAVKEEAQELMQNNEFSMDALTTVPEEICDLFVVTNELSAFEHASVQTACQKGVDSAISKTVNAPNDSSKEDAKEVFEYIYKNGGKGVTYYRDGTRSKQVLTTRADNTEFAEGDEFTETLTEQVEAGNVSVEEIIETLRDEFDVRVSTEESGQLSVSEYRKRPDSLVGINQRINTGYGTLYVWISEDAEGDMFEVFASIGKAGGYTQSFTEALCRMISMALRYGVPPKRISNHLSGIQSPKVAWEDQEQVSSVADGIAKAIDDYIEYGGVVGLITEMREGDSDIAERLAGSEPPEEMEVTQQRENVTEAVNKGKKVDLTEGPDQSSSDIKEMISDGEMPECPDCGGMNLYYSEGCKTCEECGWSEC